MFPEPTSYYIPFGTLGTFYTILMILFFLGGVIIKRRNSRQNEELEQYDETVIEDTVLELEEVFSRSKDIPKGVWTEL